MRVGATLALMLLPVSVLEAAPLSPGSVTISPVSVHLAYGQKSASLNVRNARLEPMSVQVRIYRWTQDGDEDVLTPTSDVILSPPMAIIASGTTQTLRLLMRPSSTSAARQERQYRILLDEIPSTSARPGQLKFALRSSLPLFATTEKPIVPHLEWRAERGNDKTVILTGTNSGLAYDRVVTLAATLPDGTTLNAVPRAMNPYILPASQRQWVVREKVIGDTIHLAVVTIKGRSDQSLPIGQ